MITDRENTFSLDQAITADASSTDVIDLGAIDSTSQANISKGKLIPYFHVTEAFNTLTSLTIELRTDSVSNMASPTVLYSKSVLLAGLTLGAKIFLPCVPVGTEQYLDMNYDVVGTDPTTGQITSGLVLDDQVNGH